MDDRDQYSLWNAICRKRREMGQAYELEGNTDKVLALSRELDQLLNEYDKFMKESDEP